MITLNQRDCEALTGLPRLPVDNQGPVFAEPWQAQAFSLAVKLSEQGYFTWKEWAATLADELRAAAQSGEPDDGSRYYHHWLAALERLVIEKGLTDQAALHGRKQAWIDAYQHTPHGRPVELADSTGDTHSTPGKDPSARVLPIPSTIARPVISPSPERTQSR
jgi:nitrile hydratase accessory protein